jgi:hypothetical protein
MKRVRYLAGAIGLAPLALGTAVTQGASRAVAAPEAVAHNVKTVVMQNSVCRGTYQVSATGASSRLKFWYTGETNGLTCIGTVIYSEWATSGAGWLQRTRIWAPPGINMQYSHLNGGRVGPVPPHGGGIVFSNVVRDLFGAGNVQVCVAMVEQKNHNFVGLGPLCRTVP